MSGWSALLPVWAAVLVAAGLAKLRRPEETARALGQARRGTLVRWRTLVRVGALAETVIGGVSLLRGGRPAALAMAASYAGFALYVGRARWSRRPLATCGCLGEPDTPPTWCHAVLCAAAALSAALTAAGTSAAPPSLFSMLATLGPWAPGYVATAAAAVYGTILVLGAGPRLAQLRRTAR